MKWEADHPIFPPFSKDAPELADAKFFKISLLGPTTATADRKVLARFTNGAAALVEASIGAGRTLLLHLDARSRLERPADPPRLPAAASSRRCATSRASTRVGARADHLVGSSVVAADGRPASARGPRPGRPRRRVRRRSHRRPLARCGSARTDRPGIYRVIGTDQTGATRDRDELAFVVNLDPRGTDLTPGAARRAARLRHRRRHDARPTRSAASSCGTRSPRSLLLLLLAEGLLRRRVSRLARARAAARGRRERLARGRRADRRACGSRSCRRPRARAPDGAPGSPRARSSSRARALRPRRPCARNSLSRSASLISASSASAWLRVVAAAAARRSRRGSPHGRVTDAHVAGDRAHVEIVADDHAAIAELVAQQAGDDLLATASPGASRRAPRTRRAPS